MFRRLPGSTVITTLISFSVILSFLFLAKEKWFYQEKISQYYYKSYLNSKLSIIEEVKKKDNELDKICATKKEQNINLKINHLVYQFHCQEIDLYLNKNKPTKKYVAYDRIEKHLNKTLLTQNTIKISSLSELPYSSEENPFIVIVQNDINDKLERDFHGIIITEHAFNLRNGKQFYGVLYSSFNNKTNRYSTYNANVLDNLKTKYNYWEYLPRSRNILNNEKTH